MNATKEKKARSNGCDVVRRHILTTYKIGDKLPKTADLAQELDTTQYAAERVLTELSAEGMVERIPRVGSILKGPRETSVAVVEPKMRSIAFMADEIESFLSSEIMRGIEAHCRERKTVLNLLNSNYSSKTEEELIRNLTSNHCSGAIVRVGEHKENMNILEELIPPEFPLVLVDRSDDDVRFPCVKLDQEKAAYDITKHLIDLGHRRIAHVTYDTNARPLLKEMQKRQEGYRNALEAAGIPFQPEYVQGGALFTAGEQPTQSYFDFLGYAPMNRLLLQRERPTAVFFLYFHFVLGALKAVQDHGLRVPDDISFVCIDDEPIAGYLNPPMTVYAQPLREIGAMASAILEEMIEGKSPDDKCYRLEGQLIQRDSTAPPKTA